jgi:aerobic-type carbon monoxide dehydrogenase small subunit (CoxS/CutS family)
VVLDNLGGESPRRDSEVQLNIWKDRSKFLVNGRSYDIEYELRSTLWEIIAQKIGLTGVVRSCNRGTCGSCTVLLDSTPIFSCHILAQDALGKQILTVEGLAEGSQLHPLQQIGYLRHAAQCGYCTGGWLVAARSLIEKRERLNKTIVKKSLAGHLCRCGAYNQIIDSVLEAKRLMKRDL